MAVYNTSLCGVVTNCLIEKVKYLAETNILILRVNYVMTAILGTLPIAALLGYHSPDYPGLNQYAWSVLVLEVMALIFTLTPICFDKFISQLGLLSEGPLCASFLSEFKIRQNLRWAVQELTHVSGIHTRLDEHANNAFHAQGLLRVIVALGTVYCVLKYKFKRDERALIYLFLAFTFDLGVIIMIANIPQKYLRDQYYDCLKLNVTK